MNHSLPLILVLAVLILGGSNIDASKRGKEERLHLSSKVKDQADQIEVLVAEIARLRQKPTISKWSKAN